MEKVTFEFSWETILRMGVLVASLYAIYRVREILLLIVFALIISLLFNPLIDYLQKRKVPRTLAVISVYFSVFGLFAILIYLFVPLLIIEASHFSQFFSQYFEKLSPPLRGLGLEGFQSLESFVDLAESSLSRAAQNIFSALFSIFGGILTTVFVIFLALFLSLEERAFEKSVFLLFPAGSEEMALDLWRRCQKKVSGWFLSRVLSSLFVGGLVYFSLLILQSDYPFSFGLLAAVSNFIPIVGPFFTGLLIFLLLSLTSPVKAVLAIVIFILIQQIENNVLLPILSKKFIGISPALVLISVAIGGSIGGIWGAILGIPLLGISLEFARDFLKKQKEEVVEES
ncbi:MAG: AI-2E family transporter [Candidatus Nealsonbacteria bacterium]|nr:AI-2E family transporter [Candidatus Nealsonbacteria bacterium]